MEAREGNRRPTRRRGAASDSDECAGLQRMGRPSSQSLDDWALRLLDQEPEPREEGPGSPNDGEAPREERYVGQVISVGAAGCRVRTAENDISCRIGAAPLPGWLVAGDRVVLRDADSPSPVVDQVLPRSSVLSRPDPHNGRKEKVIAANMDAVVIVQAFRDPPFRSGLVDRFLVAIQRGGARPIVCVNKQDLASDTDVAELERLLRPYEAIGIAVVRCSATTGNGLDRLRAALSGQLCAFVGHSGVGKSSLVGALHPEAAPRARPVNPNIGRGRHTTTSTTLYTLPDGTRLLDTPGVREFALWQVGHEELGHYFTELEAHAARCRFRDCSHSHEPNCAVRAEVEAGNIPQARFESYQRLRRSLD